MATCKRCNEQEASPGAVTWAGILPMLIGLPRLSSDDYCKDCGGGMTFLGLLASAAVLAIAFVVVIALW